MLIIFILIIAAILIGLMVFFVWRNLRRKRLKDALDLKLLSILLPQQQPKDQSSQASGAENWKDEINLTAQLFGILVGLKAPFGMEAAVQNVGEEIRFYIAVPKDSVQSVSRQVEGLWKDAHVKPSDDYNIFNSAGISGGIFIKQKLSYALPIRTYTEANVDTFAPILSSLSKLKEVGEGGAIQILCKPAPQKTKKSVMAIISNLKKGAKMEDVINGFKISIKDVGKALNPEDKDKKEKQEKVIDEEAIKSLESKIAKPLLAVNFRVVASASVGYEVESLLEGIDAGISQFSAPLRQELRAVKFKNPQKLIYQFSFREFDDDQAMILNSEELASLFHLPGFTTGVARVKWLKSKEAQPPVELGNKGTLIGESEFHAETKPVYISDEDKRRHVYVIGQTGTGKSNLLAYMINQDIAQGKGAAIIDPHGDLVEKILSTIPKERIDDVIYFDPSERWRPMGLNMLEYDFNRPEEKTFIVNELQQILFKLFPDAGDAMGPMFQQYMRNSLLLLMEDMPNEPATLMEIARVFTDSEFRQRKLARIGNPVVIDFWEKEAVKVGGEASLANMTPYITSKFSNFTANDYIRPIIGQIKSALNFRKIMDEKKILLVNLSKGRIGDLNANLLGMIITGKILMAALSRVDVSEDQRHDFNLYIDEFQNFTTDSIATILSEARKYGLNLTMAHQFIAQLTEKIRDAVFGNVGNIISYRVGATDAEFLVKQFEPVFSLNDLVNIDNFRAYVKILVGGKTTKPFNIHTFPARQGDKSLAEQITKASRLKYGNDRQEVETDILKRLRI